MNSFLDLSSQGKNNWWRYVLSILVILFFMIVGGIPALINRVNGVTNIELNFIATLMSIIPWILGLWIAVRAIHRRDFITLITTQRKINWKRYFYGFGGTMVVLSLLAAVDYLFHAKQYQFVLTSWSWLQFGTMLLLSVLLLPFQTAAEELLFRGYLMQWIGKKIKNPYVLSVIIGILFAVLHLANPEAAKGLLPAMMIYSTIGALYALITLRSNGLELAMGSHFANNLFVSVVVGMSDSAFITRPVFVISEWDIWDSLFPEVALSVALYFIVMRYLKNSEIKNAD